MATEQEIAALRRERAGYEQQGKADRAEQVTKHLHEVGAETDRAEAPKGRRSKPVETA